MICSSCAIEASRYGFVLLAPRGTAASAADSSPCLSPSAQTRKNINLIYLGELCKPAGVTPSAESQRGWKRVKATKLLKTGGRNIWGRVSRKRKATGF